MTPEDRKLQRLKDDFGGENDLDSLLEVGRFLNQWETPPADSAKMAALLDTLTTDTVGAKYILPLPNKIDIWLLMLNLLRAQIRIVRGAIWLASALIMAIGAVVTVATYSTGTIALVLIAPLVAAVGIAFIYGDDIDPPTELLMSTPVSQRLVLLARMALVFGFDLGLGLAASAAAVLMSPDISFMPLVLAWLAPMAFLSALAFLMSVLFNDPLVGVLVSLGLWGALVIGHLATTYGMNSFMPDLLSDGSTRFVFGALAALMVALALWLAGREERLAMNS